MEPGLRERVPRSRAPSCKVVAGTALSPPLSKAAAGLAGKLQFQTNDEVFSMCLFCAGSNWASYSFSSNPTFPIFVEFHLFT